MIKFIAAFFNLLYKEGFSNKNAPQRLKKALQKEGVLCQIFTMALYNSLLIKKLEEILKEDPGSKSFCSLAQIYLSSGRLEEAEKLCLEGLVYNPSYSQAYVILAEVYKQKGDDEKSIKVLNKAKELNPDNPNIYKLLAALYRKQNNMEKTLEAYKMAALLRPGDKAAMDSAVHLEKVLGKAALKASSSESLQKKEEAPGLRPLSEKSRQKLLKLNKILARAENIISRRKEESL